VKPSLPASYYGASRELSGGPKAGAWSTKLHAMENVARTSTTTNDDSSSGSKISGGGAAALRQALLGICGAVMVRNLKLEGVSGLGDTYCEVVAPDAGAARSELVLFRSGVVRESSNPTWTLRPLATQRGDRELAGAEETLRTARLVLRVYQLVGAPCCSALRDPGQGVPVSGGAAGKPVVCADCGDLDAFPYHHERGPSTSRRRLALEQTITLSSLRNTGISTSELAKLGALPVNCLLLGLSHSALAPACSSSWGLAVASTDASSPRATSSSGSRPGGTSAGTGNGYGFRGNGYSGGVSSSNSSLYIWVPCGSVEAGVGAPAAELVAPGTLVGSAGAPALDAAGKPDTEELLERLAAANSRAAAAEARALVLIESQVARAQVRRNRLRERARTAALVEERAALAVECADLEAKLAAERAAQSAAARELLAASERLGREDGELSVQREQRANEAAAALRKQLCFVRAHRINLLRSLQSVYPLVERYTESGQWEYYIRGIALPAGSALSLSNLGAQEEEQVATALGYLSHFVNVLSRYVNMPLRFVPLPHSSSSTVCDPLEVCAETPHEPLPRHAPQGSSGAGGGSTSAAADGNGAARTNGYHTYSAFPVHIFGSASGRLGRNNARRALSVGTYPLYWRGLSKSLRPRFAHAVDLLERDVELLAFWHALQLGRLGRAPNVELAAQEQANRASHVIARLRRVLADY
jgi:hypothetical protein